MMSQNTEKTGLQSECGVIGEDKFQVADKEICINCGKFTRDIPRLDYSIQENRENGWNYPAGGYICDECEDESYAQAHLEGSQYCPAHGFVESYFNQKDEAGNFIGCYDNCQTAAAYDRSVIRLQEKENNLPVNS